MHSAISWYLSNLLFQFGEEAFNSEAFNMESNETCCYFMCYATVKGNVDYFSSLTLNYWDYNAAAENTEQYDVVIYLHYFHKCKSVCTFLVMHILIQKLRLNRFVYCSVN